MGPSLPVTTVPTAMSLLTFRWVYQPGKCGWYALEEKHSTQTLIREEAWGPWSGLHVSIGIHSRCILTQTLSDMSSYIFKGLLISKHWARS